MINYENVKNRLRCSAVSVQYAEQCHEKANAAGEHNTYTVFKGDIALIYSIEFDDRTVPVTDEMLEECGVSKTRLQNDTVRTMQRKCPIYKTQFRVIDGVVFWNVCVRGCSAGTAIAYPDFAKHVIPVNKSGFYIIAYGANELMVVADAAAEEFGIERLFKPDDEIYLPALSEHLWHYSKRSGLEMLENTQKEMKGDSKKWLL